MTKLVYVVSLIMMISVSYAQIYKWTDSQGVIHFSDYPHQGAEQLKLPETQTYSPPTNQIPNVPSDDTNTNSNGSDDSEEKEHTYTKVAITQPLNESTIRNTEGYAMVTVELEPKLMTGDTLQLIYDGAPLGDPQANVVFQLNGMFRGSHTIAVRVLDGDGKVINTSDTVTIFMQQPRVGMGK